MSYRDDYIKGKDDFVGHQPIDERFSSNSAYMSGYSDAMCDDFYAIQPDEDELNAAN